MNKPFWMGVAAGATGMWLLKKMSNGDGLMGLGAASLCPEPQGVDQFSQEKWDRYAACRNRQYKADIFGVPRTPRWSRWRF